MSENKTAEKAAMLIYNGVTFYNGGKEMFSELVEFMDGDRDNDLLQCMKEIDEKNFPEKYVSQDEKKKEKCNCNGITEGCHVCGVMPAGAPTFTKKKE